MDGYFCWPNPSVKVPQDSFLIYFPLSFRKANAYDITAFMMVDYTIPIP